MSTETSTQKETAFSNERYLCFSLGSEEFAIPLLVVREVIAMPEITPVPHPPPHYLGIFNLRGRVISILDLRSRLGIKPKPQAETSVIICDLDPNPIGVVVDSVNSVLHPTAEQTLPKPDVKSHRDAEFVELVFRQNDKLILAIDLPGLLGAARSKKAA